MLRRPLITLALTISVAACSGATDLGGGGETPDAGTSTPDITSPPDTVDEPDIPAPEPDIPESCKEGEPCDDGDACTTDDVCHDGLCVGGVDVVCEAEDPCWLTACDAQQGCVQTSFVDGAPCDDQDPCTDNDTCTQTDAGEQTCGGTPTPIDDQNPCTEDACVDGDITHTPLDGTVCDPQSPCSDTGLCGDTVCQPDPPCECLQDADCPQPDDPCDGVALCDLSGEVPACLIDPASVVVCEAAIAPCHDNLCNPASGACEEVPTVDATPCDDVNACTGDDACIAGVCMGGFDVDCDDGLYCTGVETCAADAGCQPGTAPDVDDGVGCTVDTCDEEADAVAHSPNHDLCDNTLYCDGVESCDLAADCQPGTPPELDDGVGCTVDTCDEAADAPVHTPDDSACDNTLYCDGAESCDATADCQPGTPPEVDDGVGCTVDSCDEDADAPVHTPDDSACDNTLYCDGAESCDAAADCQPGTPPEIDDAIDCTVDSCDEDADLVRHIPEASLCDDQNPCTAESCDEAAGCGHTPTDAPCSDDDPCTGQDACVDGACAGTPILKEGPVCNNVDDDCDGSTDEDCSFGIGGVVMGGGFVTATDQTGRTMDGSSGTRRFVGKTSDGTYTLMSGLPPRGEEN